MSEMEITKYTHRYLARIVIEAETPLAVGSGEKDLLTDALVATDSNGLPYIPGTSIAGVLRHMMADRTSAMEKEGIDTDMLFGFQGRKTEGNDDKPSGRGSEIIFSEAKMLDSNANVVDGIRDAAAIAKDPLLRNYSFLPMRQHVRITDKGTAADTGLFSGQVVFAGSRFCFEIEMVADGSDYAAFESVLKGIRASEFRLGGGTRDGFGKIRVIDIATACLDLTEKSGLDAYLDKTSALDSGFWTGRGKPDGDTLRDDADPDGFIRYSLSLRPDSFFLFGSGYGDDDADMTPVKARKVVWKESDGKLGGVLRENLVLIPATSLKGALAHRTAFHCNRMRGMFTDDMTGDGIKNHTGSHNPAVRLLFGSDGDGKESGITKGNVIFSDIIKGEAPEKILNHLKIDRFSGGGIEGALFSEKALYGQGKDYETEILIDRRSLHKACATEYPDTDPEETAHEAIKAFESALADLCHGMLPLGGSVNRGHGVFTGEYRIINK